MPDTHTVRRQPGPRVQPQPRSQKNQTSKPVVAGTGHVLPVIEPRKVHVTPPTPRTLPTPRTPPAGPSTKQAKKRRSRAFLFMVMTAAMVAMAGLLGILLWQRRRVGYMPAEAAGEFGDDYAYDDGDIDDRAYDEYAAVYDEDYGRYDRK